MSHKVLQSKTINGENLSFVAAKKKGCFEITKPHIAKIT